MSYIKSLRNKILFAGFFLFLGYSLADFGSFVSEIRENIVEEQALLNSSQSFQNPFDVLAVLTGAQGRIRESLLLFKSGAAKELFISGVEPDASVDEILRASGLDNYPLQLKGHIFLDKISKTTEQNAREIVRFVADNQIRSILLVTSSYHLPRSKKLLESEFKKARLSQIRVQTFSVESTNFESHNWWTKTTGWFLMFSEYIKMRTTWIRSLLMG